jgi:hypothetical protein
MALDETRIDHESFGFIRACRVSGYAHLFDSAVNHQHYVTVTIGNASQYRMYNETYIHGRNELITVAMSESQFAQFITSMNVGSGSPCTLTRVYDKGVEPPPADINTRETFEAEVRSQAEKVSETLRKSLDAAQALRTAGKANKGDLGNLVGMLEAVQRELVANMPFMMKQFAEGVEKLTDRAKMDLNAHATMLGQRLTAPTEQMLLPGETT